MAPLTHAQNQSLDAKLGKKTDTALAAEFKVSREYIRQRRDAKDVPAFSSGAPMDTPWPIRFTRKAVAVIKRAMKVTGHTNRSEYVRDAVREKNDSVLKGGK